MPTTSSPSSSLHRTGVECSINDLRYFASSNVCSGARADFPGGGVIALLALLCRRRRGRLRRPVGGYADAIIRNAIFGRSGTSTLDLPIIAVARRNPQIGAVHANFELMETLFVERHILRIESQQVLRAKFGD